MKPSSRRDFLKYMAAFCGASLLPQGMSPFSSRLSFAASSCTTGPTAKKVTVHLFLAGGPDGKSIVVPTASQAYLDTHPTLKITNALTLNGNAGLHPNLPRIKALYDAGKVAVMNGAGYPKQNRSHEDATVTMGRGIVNSSGGSGASGWVGRFANAYCNSSEAFSIFSFRGAVDEIRGAPFAAPTGSSISSFRYQSTGNANNDSFIGQVVKADRNASGLDNPHFQAMYNAWDAGDAAVKVMGQVGTAYTNKYTSLGMAPQSYPNTGLASRLKDTAKLICAAESTSVNVKHVLLSQGGYDTHDNQIISLGGLMTELDNAIGAFWTDMNNIGRADDVVLVAYGEFGRTIENKNLVPGTDHGTGTAMFVIGNKVQGGVLSPAYQDSDFLDPRSPWVPKKFDYREPLAQIFARHQGVDDSIIFPEAFDKIGINLFT